MGKKRSVKKLKATANSGFLVYRSENSSVLQISGNDMTVAVQDGTLIVSSGGVAVYVFSPGQWLTVNSTPV